MFLCMNGLWGFQRYIHSSTNNLHTFVGKERRNTYMEWVWCPIGPRYILEKVGMFSKANNFYNFVGKNSKKIGRHIIKWTTPLATKGSLVLQLLRILKHETTTWRIEIYNKIMPITNLGHQHTSKNAGHRCTKEYKTTLQVPQQCTWDYNWLQTTCVVCKNLKVFTKFQTTKYNVVNGIFSRLN